MSDVIPYSEYENLYPETVVIRKEGTFYNVRNNGARVIHALFDFKGWRTSKGHPTVGFVTGEIDRVCLALERNFISHIVIANNEMVKGKDFGANNQFGKYKNTSIEDFSIQKTRSKGENKKTNHVFFLDETEKRLNGISITYIERLLSGIHPVYNTPISEGSVMADDNVKRCFSFVLDMLKRLDNLDEESEEFSGRKKISSSKGCVEFLDGYQEIVEKMIMNFDVRASELISLIQPHINNLFGKDIKINMYKVSNWLLQEEYLESIVDEQGTSHRQATEKGIQIGIKNKLINNGDLPAYTVYVFSPEGQRFVFERLDKIALFTKSKK